MPALVHLHANLSRDVLALELHDYRLTCGQRLPVDARLSGDREWGDDPMDFELVASDMCLSIPALLSLCESIDAWVTLPVSQINTRPLQGEFRLSACEFERLTLVFGPRADTHTQIKPIVTVHVSVGPLQCEHHFITDQSCLRLFANALRDAVAATTTSV